MWTLSTLLVNCNALFAGGASLCNHQPGHLLHVGTDRSRLLPQIMITTIYIFLLGTAFGFLVFDTKCHHIVLTKATVNPPGEILVLMETTLCPPPDSPSQLDDGVLSLAGSNKSLTSSLRESFNKIRRSHTNRCDEKKRLLYNQQSQDIPELEVV